MATYHRIDFGIQETDITPHPVVSSEDQDARFYVYAYLRKDGTPYYIGKGTGYRVYKKQRRVKPPIDSSRIVMIQTNLVEDDAIALEKYGIALFGRKDIGTGILINLTDGGEGASGFRMTETTKAKIRDAMIGVPKSVEHRAKMGATKVGNTYARGNSSACKQGYGIVTHIPTGETWKIRNITAFCRDRGLDDGHLIKTSRGKRKQHKNYRMEWITESNNG